MRTELADPTKHPDDTFTYVDVSSVSNQSFSIEKTNELTGREAPSRARKVIHCDDIIFATVRPTLRRIALVPSWLDGQICSTGYCVVRPDLLRLLPSYAYFYLLSEEVAQRVEGMQKGATYPAISDADVLGLSIPLPPLPEQRAIARVLRAVQSAREARQREVALERERKAALMAHLFTYGTRGEPTKQTPTGEMPESWEVGKVGELAAIKGGKRLPKGVDFADDETRFPYIRVVDLANGSVKTDALKYLTTETQREIAQYIIRRTDVYISIAGTIGLVGTIPPELDGANLTENAARLVIRKQEHHSRDFLAAYLSSEAGQAQINSLTSKTTQPKLALARIAQIRVPLPLFAEQQQIAQILNSCDVKVAALERESALLDELFRALLEELMTGRLPVPELMNTQ